MKRQILTVEDRFVVAERGLIATGNWLDQSQELLTGTAVEVIRPDGSSFVATLRGADLFTQCFGAQRAIGLLLKDVMEKDMVPVGSQIWLSN
ncbi:MAG: hypothetical protein ACREXY_16685 [Gammaproteobacteria bacterium]